MDPDSRRRRASLAAPPAFAGSMTDFPWQPPRLSFAARSLVHASMEHVAGLRFLLEGDVDHVARVLDSDRETVLEVREYLRAGRARIGGILRERA